MAQQLLLDVDPGCDDAVALSVAAASPAIDLVGVSTVAGNTTIDNATRNALAILEYVEAEDIPVAKGSHRPIADELETAEWVHGPGGLRGDIPDPEESTVSTTGPEFIVEQAHEYGEELVIAAVGPLSNLAVALALEPDLPEIVDEIYFMGGAAFVGGNVTPMAEFNMYNDPPAGERVAQDADARMVGLDVTNDGTLTGETIVDLGAKSETLRTVATWLGYADTLEESELEDNPSIHDAVVVADLIGDVLTFEEYYVEIDTTGGPSHGAVVCDQRGVMDEEPNTTVAVDIDVERFREIVVDALERYA
ncbi:MAG: nucleoside hydrolase [Halobacteriales archaeon]|nr:nucleoside hydrolase [Halobacteriales archaeon]